MLRLGEKFESEGYRKKLLEDLLRTPPTTLSVWVASGVTITGENIHN
jgi:hypothetical protein